MTVTILGRFRLFPLCMFVKASLEFTGKCLVQTNVHNCKNITVGSVCLSAHLHGITHVPLDRFLLHFVFRPFFIKNLLRHFRFG